MPFYNLLVAQLSRLWKQIFVMSRLPGSRMSMITSGSGHVRIAAFVIIPGWLSEEVWNCFDLWSRHDRKWHSESYPDVSNHADGPSQLRLPPFSCLSQSLCSIESLIFFSKKEQRTKTSDIEANDISTPSISNRTMVCCHPVTLLGLMVLRSVFVMALAH